jgi:hypothetical protein
MFPRDRTTAACLALSLFGASACDRAKTDADGVSSASAVASGDLLEAAEEHEQVSDAGQQTGSADKAGLRVDIEAGKFVAGSTPGDRGRDPSLEPALVPLELKAFAIDKLPYPNDPARAPLTNVTRAKAAELCKERDGRLCTELEWERACKGPDGNAYAGSNGYNARCASEPQTCASGFGVLAMGFSQREWTASDVQAIKKWQAQAAAVRGSRADAADVDHRCARRMAVAADSSSSDLGFRCCYGASNEAVIESPDWKATFRRADMPPERLEKLLSGNPRLAAIAKDIVYFRQDAAIDTIKRRGAARGMDAGAPAESVEMSTAPLLWNPVPGEEVLLVSGRSGKDTSFIVAFHRLPDDRYRVGAAMVMKDEVGPVVLVYDKYVRQKLHWTTCWECYGETGNITWRSDNRVTITQK